MKEITNAIGFIMNFQSTTKPWIDAGIGSSWYMNKSEPEMRTDFTRGDNNDGITIIDLVENKYCFMNICEQDLSSYKVYSLPSLTPVDARAYVTAYYGETIETHNPYYFGNHERELITKTREEQQEIINKTIEINRMVLEGFDKFEVLTQAEIKKIFPKVKLTKTEVI
jgi:hypothetical protein